MELTKEKKHEMYKTILSDIESDKQEFCCDSLISNKFTNSFSYCKSLMPELYELKTTPIEKNFSWFNNKEERIIALKKCIEQTK